MCRLLGVSKQAYYKHEDKLVYRLASEAFVVEFVKEIRRKAPGMGGGKLWQMYNRRFGGKWHVGFNRFYDILERHSLKLRRRRRRALTTDSRHGLPFYPNLVKELIPDAPCQLIVSDITYIVYGTNPETEAYSFCNGLLYEGDCGIQRGGNVGDPLSAGGVGNGPAALRRDGSFRLDPSFRPGDTIRQLRLYGAVEKGAYPHQHDRKRESEGQCGGRAGQQHGQERTARRHEFPKRAASAGSGENGGGLLQQRTPPLESGRHDAG